MLSANNFGEAGTYINADYGGRWASNVVNVVEQYVRTAGYDTQVTVVGGGDFEVGKDLEPGWNGPQRTLDWADGYGRATSLPFYNYGDAAGCPLASSEMADNSLGCQNGWGQRELLQLSRRDVYNRQAVPQIYTHNGVQAQQWYHISRFGAAGLGPIPFAGVLTTFGACQLPLVDRDERCPFIDNLSAEGWLQLYDALKQDLRTPYEPPYSTDIKYSFQP